MINRVLARSSVFQELFAYYHSESHSVEEAEDSLSEALSSIQLLYYFLLDLIPALTQLHKEQIEKNKTRFILREEDLNPNLRLAENNLSSAIDECSTITEALRNTKLSWRDNDALLKVLLEEILDSNLYENYRDSKEESFALDAKFWAEALQKLTFKNRLFDDYLSDLSIYWNDPTAVLEKVEIEEIPSVDKLDEMMDDLRLEDSYQTVRMSNSPVEVQKDFVIKTLRKARKVDDIASVLIPMFKDKEDEDFTYQLLRSSIVHSEQYLELIDEALQNWDSERLADSDIILLQMGLAELFTFPSVTAAVTLNEYIELGKTFSTSKSGSFINGLLDSILQKLRDEGKIRK